MVKTYQLNQNVAFMKKPESNFGSGDSGAGLTLVAAASHHDAAYVGKTITVKWIKIDRTRNSSVATLGATATDEVAFVPAITGFLKWDTAFPTTTRIVTNATIDAGHTFNIGTTGALTYGIIPAASAYATTYVNAAPIARAKTKLASTGTGFWIFKEGSAIKMPIVEYQRTNVGGVLTVNGNMYRIPDKMVMVPGNIEVYTQDDSLIDMALGNLGEIPSETETLHWEEDVSRFESYGAYVSEYELDIKGSEPVTQKATLGCFSSREEIGAGTDVTAYTDVALLTSAIVVRGQCKLEVAAENIAFDSCNLKIKNIVKVNELSTGDPNAAGSGFEAVFEGREISMEYTSSAEENLEVTSILGTTLIDKTVIYTVASLFTFTVTHCDIVCENIGDVAEMKNGLRTRTFKIYPTITSVITKA